MEREYRTRLGQVLQVEKREDGGLPVIQGYAALFNERTVIWNWFTESIAPGAFKRAIDEKDDCRSLFNHDANFVLGRTKSGTLVLREDSKGLWTETTPPDTNQARDVVENIRVGNVDGMSFGFIIRKQMWTMSEDPKQMDHREIQEVELFDISPCTYPQYDQTSVGVRASSERAHLEARAAWEAARQEAEKQDSPIITITGPYPSVMRKKVLALRHKFRHTFA